MVDELEVDMQRDIRVVAFDLDDTLAVSKTRIDDEMARLLARLLSTVDVCIISGGRFEQFVKQVLQHLDVTDTARARLHLMPTCGTRYYRWVDSRWHALYIEDLSESDKLRVVDTLTQGAKELGMWEENTWGDIIEDRGSQITFSALGQSAPAEAKYRWDPDGTKKHALRAWAVDRLPDLEVRAGGSTSIDVTKKGVDKAYGMRQLVQRLNLDLDEVLFVGDRLEPGGNDYPVKEMGIQCVAVERWEDTAAYVEKLLANQATGLGRGLQPVG
ncbi:haloacid dehalogenase [Catellatospora sp. TT07R-123]|uniref:HAD-IIB family hydrolase n=1 Tax=Catellatospora sp. TT07R-123 TaxID=2733863 RepID=UPI001B1F0F76|nr:HAD-IIB family hydrolase [Catellatospora sp. TT07R-123]GHJ45779.1 haloacid dehalogenase [Catellatospora sp. TT07R-123]